MIGKFLEYISNDETGIIISSRMATDPYVPLMYLQSLVEPIRSRIVGCVSYELDGMMLLRGATRVKIIKSIYESTGVEIFSPQLWGLGGNLEDYADPNCNRKPNSFAFHQYLSSFRPDLKHYWNIPIQKVYSHPGYYSFLDKWRMTQS